MKHFVLLATVLLYSCLSFGRGYLSVEGRYFTNSQEIKPVVGFGIYEKFSKFTAFNSWSGFGQPDSLLYEDMTWYTTRNQVDFIFNKIVVSPGFQYNYVDTVNLEQKMIYLKVTTELWK